MSYRMKRPNRNIRGDGGNANRQADEKTNEFVARAQEHFLSTQNDRTDIKEERIRGLTLGLIIGSFSSTFLFISVVEYREYRDGHIGRKDKHVPAQPILPIKNDAKERTMYYKDGKTVPNPTPLDHFREIAPPVSGTCLPEIASSPAAQYAGHEIAVRVNASAVPIRLAILSNGKDTVRVVSTVMVDSNGKAMYAGSKAFGAANPRGEYVSAQLEPDLSAIIVAPPPSYPCLLTFVNIIPPA